MELMRAQFIALLSCVKITPSSARKLQRSSGVSSVTLCPKVVAMLNYSQTLFSHTRRGRTIRRRKRIALQRNFAKAQSICNYGNGAETHRGAGDHWAEQQSKHGK